VTLNPVKPDLLARGVNRLREFAKEATSDRDVLRRRRPFLKRKARGAVRPAVVLGKRWRSALRWRGDEAAR
jgi:hypothetical protein